MRQGNSCNAELDRLIIKFSDMVYRLAILRCRSKDDAEDVYQEVFIKLVRNIHKLNNDEHVKAWLIRVTINQCNSLYTDSWHKKNVSYDDTLENELLSDEGYLEEDERETVVKAVRTLPPDYRIVIHLFYYEQFSVKEISSILDISESNVKVRLNRARNKLKGILIEEGVR